eukprot:SAG11_NODE_15779_length_570_cov_5.357602_1_plen_51_part_01
MPDRMSGTAYTIAQYVQRRLTGWRAARAASEPVRQDASPRVIGGVSGKLSP